MSQAPKKNRNMGIGCALAVRRLGPWGCVALALKALNLPDRPINGRSAAQSASTGWENLVLPFYFLLLPFVGLHLATSKQNSKNTKGGNVCTS